MADQTPQSLDLTPEIINLELQQGTDNPITFQLTDNDGNAVDITNDEVKFTAKDDFAGTVKIATKTNGVGGHATPANGETTFVLTASDLTATSATEEEIWRYEIRRVFAGSGYELVYIHGEITLKPSVGLDS